MKLLNPIIALIHDTVHDKWHPVVFEESPLPGGKGPVRHRSHGHHTTGFRNRELAEKEATEDLKAYMPEARLELGTVFEWDGEGVPALVHFFPPATKNQLEK